MPRLEVGDAKRIDAEYGLEPVIEFKPGAEADVGSAELQFQSIQCPYCGERFESPLDLSAGSASYIEDCQICCQPIEVTLEVDFAGALQALTALRTG